VEDTIALRRVEELSGRDACQHSVHEYLQTHVCRWASKVLEILTATDQNHRREETRGDQNHAVDTEGNRWLWNEKRGGAKRQRLYGPHIMSRHWDRPSQETLAGEAIVGA
jgi:hypothetical protein